MREVSIALIGGGMIARAHAAAIRTLPVCFPDVPRLRPLVVCDATLELAEAAAARLDFPEAMVGWEQVVARKDVDAVIITTPPDLHHDIAVAALRAGKHVLCEKPLARTADEAREMVDVARGVGVTNMVGFTYRQAPALLQARKLIQEGALGEIVHVTGRYFQDFGRDASRPTNWRYQARRAGSGALADIGSHLVDCIRWLVGDVERVSSVARTVVAERPRADRAELESVDVDDYAAFLAQFVGGALGTFELSRVASGRKNQLAIEVNGGRGSLTFDWQRANELQYFSSAEPTDRQGFRTILVGPEQPGFAGLLPVPGLGVGFLDAFVVQAASFARAIDGQPPAGSLATFEDGLRVNEILDAAIESARTQQWVNVRC